MIFLENRKSYHENRKHTFNILSQAASINLYFRSYFSSFIIIPRSSLLSFLRTWNSLESIKQKSIIIRVQKTTDINLQAFSVKSFTSPLTLFGFISSLNTMCIEIKMQMCDNFIFFYRMNVRCQRNRYVYEETRSAPMNT